MNRASARWPDVRKPTWFWMVAVAFASHNAEEGVGAPLLLQQMQSRAPAFLRELYAGVQVADMRASLLILSVIGLLLAALAARSATSRAWSYVMLVFGTLIGLNGLAHAALSLVWRDYMPGTLTALFVTLPVSVALLIRSRRDAWIAPWARWTLLPAAVVVHGPILGTLIPALVRVVTMQSFTGGVA